MAKPTTAKRIQKNVMRILRFQRVLRMERREKAGLVDSDSSGSECVLLTMATRRDSARCGPNGVEICFQGVAGLGRVGWYGGFELGAEGFLRFGIFGESSGKVGTADKKDASDHVR